jgi:SAM-dependent methyltransferase
MDSDYNKRIWDRYVSTFFSNAHPIDKLVDEYKTTARYYKKNYLKHLPENKECSILEIGCGLGHFLNFLEKWGYKKYIGIGLSDEEIGVCRRFNFNVLKADVFNFLEDKRGSFDVVVLNDTIEHFTRSEVVRLLQLIHSCLKGGGTLFVKTVNMSNYITAPSGRYIDFTHKIGFTEESLKQVCLFAGLDSVKVFGADIYVFYFNPLNYIAKFLSFILGWGMRLSFLLYGRKTTKIFSKNIIAVCRKE